MDLETALLAAEKFELEVECMAPTRSKAAERQARYRARKASPTVTDHNDASQTITRDAPFPETKVSPEPPSKTQPIPDPPKPPLRGSKGSRLPDNWRPDHDGLRYAAEVLGFNVDPERELDRFRDYWRAVPGAKGLKLDWPATWRNWCRNAADRLPRKAHERPRPDHRETAFRERLDDIGAAMAASVEQSRREH